MYGRYFYGQKKLTPKQQAFIDEYLIDFNASATAVRAGYSPKTARYIGYENITKPHIQKAIQERIAELQKKARVDQERVLQMECCIAFSDIRKLFDGEAPTPLEDLQEVAQAIASFEIKELDLYANGERVETITDYKYKFWDKGRSLERLGRGLGMYKEPGDKVGQGLEKLTGVLEEALKRKRKLLESVNAG